MDKLNIQKPIEVEENIEKENERPRWMPKVTRNRYFRQSSEIESISERPKTKDQIICAEKKIAKRRAKNKAAKKARRKNRK